MVTEVKLCKYNWWTVIIMKCLVKRLISKILGKIGKPTTYELYDTFGCPEKPPTQCPTFLERDVHKNFQAATRSYNIIVVYGESRQGKTWTIERYCPEQLRIGCNSSMKLADIKREMLHVIGVDVRQIEHSITEEVSSNKIANLSGNISNAKTHAISLNAGLDNERGSAHKETLKTSYFTVDINNLREFLDTLCSKTVGKYFVFDNFHYLTPMVQQEFCSLLKEFNYREIKVIIVGVWKDASRITAMAPDLINRCGHIDIGTWSDRELMQVAQKGEKALNIKIEPQIVKKFINCSANNIGIFKDFMQKYCQKLGIMQTETHERSVDDFSLADQAAKEVVEEAYAPLHDRIINLARPQRKRKESKRMRQRIIIALLTLILESNSIKVQNGFALGEVKDCMDELSRIDGEEPIGISNLTQELGVIHEREENRDTERNFIPLFYYDKANKKVLVLEPTIYEVKSYDKTKISEIIKELKGT